MKEGYKVEFDMYLISAQVVATQNLSTITLLVAIECSPQSSSPQFASTTQWEKMINEFCLKGNSTIIKMFNSEPSM